MSQALHRYYPTQHFLNTFADVFADSASECLWAISATKGNRILVFI
jgi:hypothetical protein